MLPSSHPIFLSSVTFYLIILNIYLAKKYPCIPEGNSGELVDPRIPIIHLVMENEKNYREFNAV